MRIVKLVVVIPIFALIAGCFPYTGGDNIKRLTDDLVASARVGSIVVLRAGRRVRGIQTGA